MPDLGLRPAQGAAETIRGRAPAARGRGGRIGRGGAHLRGLHDAVVPPSRVREVLHQDAPGALHRLVPHRRLHAHGRGTAEGGAGKAANPRPGISALGTGSLERRPSKDRPAARAPAVPVGCPESRRRLRGGGPSPPRCVRHRHLGLYWRRTAGGRAWALPPLNGSPLPSYGHSEPPRFAAALLPAPHADNPSTLRTDSEGVTGPPSPRDSPAGHTILSRVLVDFCDVIHHVYFDEIEMFGLCSP